MRAVEYWAEKFIADNSNLDLGRVKESARLAYLAGFKAAQDHAAQLMVELQTSNSRRGEQLAILIRGIGSAQVDPKTGERIW